MWYFFDASDQTDGILCIYEKEIDGKKIAQKCYVNKRESESNYYLQIYVLYVYTELWTLYAEN